MDHLDLEGLMILKLSMARDQAPCQRKAPDLAKSKATPSTGGRSPVMQHHQIRPLERRQHLTEPGLHRIRPGLSTRRLRWLLAAWVDHTSTQPQRSHTREIRMGRRDGQ